MSTVMKASEFVAKIKNIADDHKTLYVMGCFGAPMTAVNKDRYTRNHEYNRKPSRTAMIKAATRDTFGFDCVNMIKAVLWGWSGDKSKAYGGAKYLTNGVPDVGANAMIKLCTEVSTDFTKIMVGEAVWMEGHIGVYVGDGLAVECTPSWRNGVQYTACNRSKTGYNRRNWTKHGKMPWIEYDVESSSSSSSSSASAQGYTLKQFVMDIQRATGAKIDGDAGPETLSKTITLSTKLNNKHPAVYYVQRRLRALGYTEVGAIDGSFGPKTKSAVMHFQKDHGRTVDGEITARQITWKKLLGMA